MEGGGHGTLQENQQRKGGMGGGGEGGGRSSIGCKGMSKKGMPGLLKCWVRYKGQKCGAECEYKCDMHNSAQRSMKAAMKNSLST